MLGPWRRSTYALPSALDDLRYRALASAFRVHTALGPTLKETLYRKALVHALRRDGFQVQEEQPFDLEFEGLSLKGALRPDIIVDEALVLEVKAVEVHREVWEAQVLSYLWRTGLPMGYIVNFRVTHLRDGLWPFINLPEPEEPVSPSTTAPPSTSSSSSSSSSFLSHPAGGVRGTLPKSP